MGEAATAVTEKMNATLRSALEKRLETFNSKKEGETSSGIDLSGVVVSGSGNDASKDDEDSEEQSSEEKLNDTTPPSEEDFSYGE